MTGENRLVYLAGPMSGYPFFNFHAFFDYEALLRRQGHEVWNPARNDITKHGDFYLRCPNGTREELAATGVALTYRTALKDDLAVIMDKATDIAMMPGWEHSKGAAVESALAECLGLGRIILPPRQLIVQGGTIVLNS